MLLSISQGDWVWLEPEGGARGEHPIAVGAVVKNVDHHKIYLVDDDRKVFDTERFDYNCSLKKSWDVIIGCQFYKQDITYTI